MTDQNSKVLQVNEQFYQALIDGDYRTMESLWADSNEVAVIHPGWPALHGRQAVMDSWRRILEGVSTRNMICSNARCYIKDSTAFVICSERFPEGDLVATNIFVNETGEWKIVHHQGGPLQSVLEDEAVERLH